MKEIDTKPLFSKNEGFKNMFVHDTKNQPNQSHYTRVNVQIASVDDHNPNSLCDNITRGIQRREISFSRFVNKLQRLHAEIQHFHSQNRIWS